MGAYFARLLLKGVTTLFLAWMVLFTLVTYTPGGSVAKVDGSLSGFHRPISPIYDNYINNLYHTHKPWPLSYIVWLFDPSDTFDLHLVYYDVFLAEATQTYKGIDINLAGLHIRGSGILTADFGISTDLHRDQKVTDVFGRGVSELMLLTLLLLFASMTLVAAQRRRRPHANEQPHTTSQMRSPRYGISITNELFRVQFGGNL